ncbi:hypothetical protein PROFUN_09597 [Planoprotostelium fungivorum]|uniref:Protein KTI12 homolog n=1 Tax=Planoprotostelium fungivorum TaxID=1890364 RepID=A0A2P6NGV0_9EUKA|nr:hypothetical protein PROFUN_09597 [Planoprotostelium fungivorum]
MPLLLMCGIPCSGKSQRAKEIHDYLKEAGRRVMLVGEDTLNIPRNDGYKDARLEKSTRGSLLSNTERYLDTETTIIVDSLNYIKGFRYEIFCRSRSLRTPNCVVYCETPRDEARKWNVSREENARWDDALFEDMCNRFEVPNPRNRWDRPLFILRPEDVTPLEDIKNSLHETAENVPKNPATEYEKMEEPNFVYEMDQMTQTIINAVLEASNQGLSGDMVVPKSKHRISFLFIALTRMVNLAELRRIKKQFVKMATQNPQPVDTIGDAFVLYLNSNINS